MCQFLYSEGAAWKRSGQLCFLWLPEVGVKRQQGTSVTRWDAVSPPCCLHKSPCGGCYLHAAHEAMEAGGCPICLCQAKLSITSIFQAPFDRLYCWMLHSNKVPTAFFFLHHVKKVFKSKQLTHLKEERTGQQAWPSANFCFLILESILFFPPPFLFLNSPALELKKPQNSSVALALPSCHLAQGQWDAESSTAHLLPMHCNALAKSEKMCKHQRKSFHWQRKDCAHQPLPQSTAALQIDWKEDSWAALFSLTNSR